MSLTLSLTEAIRSNRLQEFIAQEESRGVEPATRKDLDRALQVASMTRHSAENPKANLAHRPKRKVERFGG